jgi:hypothetical protein
LHIEGLVYYSFFIVQASYSQAKRETLGRINLKLDVLSALPQMALKMKLLAENQ